MEENERAYLQLEVDEGFTVKKRNKYCWDSLLALDRTGTDGYTPFHIAVKLGDLRIVAYLSKGVSVT